MKNHCTDTQNLLGPGKFGLCSNQPKNGSPSRFICSLGRLICFVRCLKKLKVVETTDKIGCDNRFVGQGNRYICSENRFQAVGAQTKLSVGTTDFNVRCENLNTPSWRMPRTKLWQQKSGFERKFQLVCLILLFIHPRMSVSSKKYYLS
jgi:hypothetical protein